MIIDGLINFKKYFQNDLFEIIYQKICSIDNDHALGEFSLIEDEVFYKVIEYYTKDSDWITESHKKYVDIQIILSGEETIKVYNSESTKIKNEYNNDTDCIFYNVEESNYLSKIKLKKDYFCVFYPQDIHQTQIAINNNPILIKKLVFKVNEKFFT